MEDDYFGQAAADLKVAGECEGDARDHRVAQAQVSALLAVAASLGDAVSELRRIRHAMGDWSDD